MHPDAPTEGYPRPQMGERSVGRDARVHPQSQATAGCWPRRLECLASIWYCLFLFVSLPREVLFQCGFNLDFPDDWQCAVFFLCLFAVWVSTLVPCLFKFLAQLLSWVAVLFSYCRVLVLSIYSAFNSLDKKCDLHLSSFLGALF